MSDLAQAAFDRAAAVIKELSTTANVKQARERLAHLAVEVRETADPSSELPELAEQIDGMAETLKAYPGNNKAQVGPKLSELLAWVNEHRPINAVEAKNRLEEIEHQIHALGHQAARSLINIGGLLKEAREEYGKTDTFNFLAWCEGNFGFKKAYVYRLISVNEKFGNDPVLSGVALGALAHLTGASAEKIEQARELAGKGELDIKAAKAIAKGGDEEKGAPDAGPQMPDVIKGPELPRQNVAPSAPPNPDKEPGEVREVTPAEYESEQVAQLKGIIEDLRTQLSQMMQEREQGKRKGATSQMPSLPQFKSKSMPARLGLDPEEAREAKAVRSAFRGLVKAGYGDGHPDHPALVEALEELTK